MSVPTKQQIQLYSSRAFSQILEHTKKRPGLTSASGFRSRLGTRGTWGQHRYNVTEHALSSTMARASITPLTTVRRCCIREILASSSQRQSTPSRESPSIMWHALWSEVGSVRTSTNNSKQTLQEFTTTSSPWRLSCQRVPWNGSRLAHDGPPFDMVCGRECGYLCVMFVEVCTCIHLCMSVYLYEYARVLAEISYKHALCLRTRSHHLHTRPGVFTLIPRPSHPACRPTASAPLTTHPSTRFRPGLACNVT